jgi:hypothetical protein
MNKHCFCWWQKLQHQTKSALESWKVKSRHWSGNSKASQDRFKWIIQQNIPRLDIIMNKTRRMNDRYSCRNSKLQN